MHAVKVGIIGESQKTILSILLLFKVHCGASGPGGFSVRRLWRSPCCSEVQSSVFNV